jgi:hypothetical protein
VFPKYVAHDMLRGKDLYKRTLLEISMCKLKKLRDKEQQLNIHMLKGKRSRRGWQENIIQLGKSIDI